MYMHSYCRCTYAYACIDMRAEAIQNIMHYVGVGVKTKQKETERERKREKERERRDDLRSRMTMCRGVIDNNKINV